MKKETKQKLFDYFAQEHDIMLLDGDFNELDIIINEAIADHEAKENEGYYVMSPKNGDWEQLSVMIKTREDAEMYLNHYKNIYPYARIMIRLPQPWKGDEKIAKFNDSTGRPWKGGEE